MSRTVHVLDPAAPGCGLALCDALAILQEDDLLVILGGRDHAASVRRRRVVVDANVPMPLGIPRLASRQLGKVLKRLVTESVQLDPRFSPETFREPIGQVMAWSESALVATLGADHGLPVIGQIAAVSGRPPRIEPWRRDQAIVHPIGPEIGPLLARRGWRIGESRSAADFPMQDVEHRCGRRADRALVRGQWGVRRPEELVVAIAADPPSSAAFSSALTAAATAGVAGRSMTLIADPQSGQTMAASRQLADGEARLSGESVHVVFDERVRDPRFVAPAVDVVVTIDRS
jgi:hypothetical protein